MKLAAITGDYIRCESLIQGCDGLEDKWVSATVEFELGDFKLSACREELILRVKDMGLILKDILECAVRFDFYF